MNEGVVTLSIRLAGMSFLADNMVAGQSRDVTLARKAGEQPCRLKQHHCKRLCWLLLP